MNEPLPLAVIQRAVFDFLRNRSDCAVFGAQAVNAYVEEMRATEDVDIASTRAAEVAEEMKVFLNEKFHIATRVRSVRGGIGFRVYQLKNPKNRHLVDVRPVESLPPFQNVDGIQVVTPAESIANKIASLVARKHKDKGLTDARDLRVMLRAFPDLKSDTGPVRDRLEANGASPEVFQLWQDWVARELEPEDEDDEFDY